MQKIIYNCEYQDSRLFFKRRKNVNLDGLHLQNDNHYTFISTSMQIAYVEKTHRIKLSRLHHIQRVLLCELNQQLLLKV